MSAGSAMAAPAPALPRAVGTDAGVQSTNDDAQLCKLSCVNGGYYQDPFLRLFVRRALRKSPLINRGCWTRYAAMRQVLHQFLLHAHQSSNSTSSPAAPDAAGASDAVPSTSGSSIQCQVVVLGAGFDTTWFQLTSTRTAAAAAAAAQGAEGGVAGGMSAGAAVSSASAGPSTSDAAPAPSAPPPPAAAAASIPSLFGLPRRAGPAAGGAPGGAVPPAPDTAAAAAVLEEHTRYIEVDFPEVAARKARSILSHPELWQLLPEGTHAEAEAHEEPLGQAAAVAGATEGAAPGAEAGPSSGRSSPSRSKAVWVRASSVPSSSSTPAGVAEASPAVDVKAGASASSSSSSEQPGVAPSAVAAHHAQELQGSRYSLVGADLRQLGQLQEALGRAGWDPSIPTLWVSECCLIYLDPAEAAALLSWVAAASTGPAAIAIYEQTRPHDAFGRTMLANLVDRGCPLRSIDAVPTPGDQVQRLLHCGWTAAAAADMHRLFHGRPPGAVGGGPRPPMPPPGAGHVMPAALYNSGSVCSSSGSAAAAAATASSVQQQQPQLGLQWWSPGWLAERARIQRLEMLDEVEEWQLLQEHYVLVLGIHQPQQQHPELIGSGAEQPTPLPDDWLHTALQLQALAALGAG